MKTLNVKNSLTVYLMFIPVVIYILITGKDINMDCVKDTKVKEPKDGSLLTK